MENINENDIRYKEAARRVKRIKNFYVFTFIYFAVNLFILFLNYKELEPGETIWKVEYFVLPFFWGIGLVGYALSVFLPGFILGNKWEEKKIKELMDKNK
ncbi:2TM domain-containing protein [Chryseobacterium daecheongense]|uniref:2TM domain-containing protein n=1 Tax=Chryseobacterium daecheongense TaxID=192389 RepID=A0A3N0VTI2_9FLAO|nr:2TM domain-containing protein [Chryseobacterium daecheongense]ROH96041.1 histidine kinase [Chryseobacterium daecheongense]TDX91550.1 2TM domain-containing protein [Chryseobacterium daecheongense]